jgi:hypothetical protein
MAEGGQMRRADLLGDPHGQQSSAAGTSMGRIGEQLAQVPMVS